MKGFLSNDWRVIGYDSTQLGKCYHEGRRRVSRVGGGRSLGGSRDGGRVGKAGREGVQTRWRKVDWWPVREVGGGGGGGVD